MPKKKQKLAEKELEHSADVVYADAMKEVKLQSLQSPEQTQQALTLETPEKGDATKRSRMATFTFTALGHTRGAQKRHAKNSNWGRVHALRPARQRRPSTRPFL